MQNKNYFITIGRQFGAGGVTVGRNLARRFGIPFYDKQILSLASKESGISREFFERNDESPAGVKARSFLGINLNSISISDFFSASIVDDSELFRIQSDAVRNAAAFGSAIFVGRCADYILRNEKRCLNVFISADMSDRIGRIRSDKRIKDADTKSDEEIKELLFKADKKRANYYDYYSFRKWGAARNYDLCVSSSKFGIEGCVEIISRIVETRFNVNI